MVGMVVTISPSFNLYKIVVFPAASRPTEKRKKNLQIHVKILNQNLDLPIKIRICFLPKSRPNKLEMVNPIIYVQNSVKNCKNLFLKSTREKFPNTRQTEKFQICGVEKSADFLWKCRFDEFFREIKSRKITNFWACADALSLRLCQLSFSCQKYGRYFKKERFC